MTKENDAQWTLGILGGSGLYDLAGLENKEWVSVNTPWGCLLYTSDAADE